MSSVSGFLHHPLAPEAQEAIFLPWIQASFSALFPLLTDVNKAHLVMLRSEGHLSVDESSALIAAIINMEESGPASVVLDGALEDVYFNYEAELTRKVGPDLGGRLHLARSRNDLQSTLDRMRARSIACAMMKSTIEIRRALLNRAPSFFGCVMPGYTHLQHAQPITFGSYLLGIEQGLQRDFSRIYEAFDRINRSPLGAGALAGTTFRIDRKMTASLLGFSGPMAHSGDAVSTKDPILELQIAGLFLSTTIGRMAQDFYQFTTYEFGMLELPDSLAITSSIMPQKKNQAVLEFIKGRQAQLLGAAVASFTAFHAKPNSHALDANAESLVGIWTTLDGLNLLLPVVQLVVEAVEARRDRMAELADANFCTATDLADLLVRQHGLSFKEAHHITGRVVRLALDRGLKPQEVGPEVILEASCQVINREIAVSAEDVRSAFDPLEAVNRRQDCGGPSIKDSTTILVDAVSQLARDEAAYVQLCDQLQLAAKRLAAATQQLARSPGATEAAMPG